MDKTVSERALKLRDRILEMGYPCAVSFYPFAAEHLKPVLCILTYQDAIGNVRSASPFDEVPALVLGEGFVSSLYNAEQFHTEESLLARMEEILFAYLQTEKQDFSGIPVYFLKNGFAVNKLQIYYRIFCLQLTEREKRILRLILYAPDEIHTYRRIEAYTFPYPYSENIPDTANTITAHISSINRKAIQNAGKRLIKYRKMGNHAGYILQVRNP